MSTQQLGFFDEARPKGKNGGSKQNGTRVKSKSAKNAGATVLANRDTDILPETSVDGAEPADAPRWRIS